MKRTYKVQSQTNNAFDLTDEQCALRLLETRRRKGRPIYPALSPESRTTAQLPGNSTVKGVPSLHGMKEWLQILGHSDDAVDNLNVIHVAGTKGKGSTCAFTSSFLLAHGLRTGFPKRVGLYTSPDLQCIRERIQINNQPITEDLFTRYFFEIWDALMSPSSGQLSESTKQPRYLQLLALVAFHTFIKQDVGATIVETHHGGEFDATNVVQKPIVTGITSLGMDHVAQLGPMIEDIAWHKAGIFKSGAPAFSVEQEPGPSEALRKRAAEKRTDLTFISSSNKLPVNSKVLSVPVQRLNCSLALQLAMTFIRRKSSEPINFDDIQRGVNDFFWAGRFEIIREGDTRWFLDGAHNTLSLKQVAEWFSKNIEITARKKYSYRVLVFSHLSEERDGVALVKCLACALTEWGVRLDHVIFTTYEEREDGFKRIDKHIKSSEKSFQDLGAQYSKFWRGLHPHVAVSIEPTIEGAIKLAKRLSVEQDGMEVLVTGSLHMVGGALKILRP